MKTKIDTHGIMPLSRDPEYARLAEQRAALLAANVELDRQETILMLEGELGGTKDDGAEPVIKTVRVPVDEHRKSGAQTETQFVVDTAVARQWRRLKQLREEQAAVEAARGDAGPAQPTHGDPVKAALALAQGAEVAKPVDRLAQRQAIEAKRVAIRKGLNALATAMEKRREAVAYQEAQKLAPRRNELMAAYLRAAIDLSERLAALHEQKAAWTAAGYGHVDCLLNPNLRGPLTMGRVSDHESPLQIEAARLRAAGVIS